MIIEIDRNNSGCFARFKIPPTAARDQVRVRLLDVSVPDPPLLSGYIAGFTTDIDSFDTPVCRTMLEFINFVDSMVDSVSGARLLEGYFDGAQLEIFARTKTVNVSDDLRAVIKMPAALLLNIVESSTLNERSIDISDGYAVELQVGGAEGFYREREGYTHVVATFPRGASKPIADYWLTTREPLTSGTIRVCSRRRSTGALEEIIVHDGERWSARIEIDVARRNINHRRKM